MTTISIDGVETEAFVFYTGKYAVDKQSNIYYHANNGLWLKKASHADDGNRIVININEGNKATQIVAARYIAYEALPADMKGINMRAHIVHYIDGNPGNIWPDNLELKPRQWAGGTGSPKSRAVMDTSSGVIYQSIAEAHRRTGVPKKFIQAGAEYGVQFKWVEK